MTCLMDSTQDDVLENEECYKMVWRQYAMGCSILYLYRGGVEI